jgi:hypothetical protein
MPATPWGAFCGSKKSEPGTFGEIFRAPSTGQTFLAECHRKADWRQKVFRRLLRGCAVARLRGCRAALHGGNFLMTCAGQLKRTSQGCQALMLNTYAEGCETKFFELNFPAGFLGWFA